MTTAVIAAAAALVAQQPLQGQALLDDLSRRAVKFFWETPNPRTHFSLDRAPNFDDSATSNGEISSIASTGYALAACAVGAKRGWIRKDEALERARDTLRQVYAKSAHKNGWFFHFVDWQTGKRVWNCEASTIDTSLFLNGALVAQTYFKDKEFDALFKKIADRIDWKWMLTDGGAKPDSVHFTMGWRPEEGFLGARWDSFNELMHLELIAYTLWPEMPVKSWETWKRPVVEYAGYKLLAGGPLFLHQMAQGFYDFAGRRDRLGFDYWVDSRNATLAQIAFCKANPGKFVGYSDKVWGLSACDNPDGYNANGAPVWVTDNGTLAPACATASVLFTPKESLEATEAIVKQYPKTYGIYGFTTGFNPSRKWQSPDVIGIDIGQLMLNIENAKDGTFHKLVMADPRVQAAFAKIGLNKTSEGPPESRPLKR